MHTALSVNMLRNLDHPRLFQSRVDLVVYGIIRHAHLDNQLNTKHSCHSLSASGPSALKVPAQFLQKACGKAERLPVVTMLHHGMLYHLPAAHNRQPRQFTSGQSHGPFWRFAPAKYTHTRQARWILQAVIAVTPTVCRCIPTAQCPLTSHPRAC